MRIGYFGGSFDPPHRGHLAVAQAAADAFGLDRVLLVPTGRQPLKKQGARAAWPDRMAMTRLLCAEDPRMQASELDAPHQDGSPNYTVETLQRLRESEPSAEIFSIIGADSFQDMHRWRESARLLELAQWIVVSRPGFELTNATEAAGEGEPWTAAQRERLHVLPTVHMDISATEIRQRLELGISTGSALTAAVVLYISRMHLYHG